MASALSAISSLIASTTGSSTQANQASGLQKQLQALQKQLASTDCITCSDTRQNNQQVINQQIQKVQTQLAQAQPSQSAPSQQANNSNNNANSGQSSQSQSGGTSAPSISFSHLGGLINTTA